MVAVISTRKFTVLNCLHCRIRLFCALFWSGYICCSECDNLC